MAANRTPVAVSASMAEVAAQQGEFSRTSSRIVRGRNPLPRVFDALEAYSDLQRQELIMVKLELDPELLERANLLTGLRSESAVIELALRRLIASKQKHAMIDGIAALKDLPAELGAPADRPKPATG